MSNPTLKDQYLEELYELLRKLEDKYGPYIDYGQLEEDIVSVWWKPAFDPRFQVEDVYLPSGEKVEDV
jgi:hypothetical protein